MNRSKRRREVDGKIEKFCRYCSKWVPLLECVKVKDAQDGYAPRCKLCVNGIDQANRDRREARAKSLARNAGPDRHLRRGLIMRIDDEQRAWLKQSAKQNGTTVSEFVRSRLFGDTERQRAG